METSAPKKRILILGGGFAGAYTALHLEKRLASEPDVEIMVVSRENFVLFTPMLHEVAGADVSVTDIVQPLRKMLRRTHVGIADVEAIDLANKQVRIRHSGRRVRSRQAAARLFTGAGRRHELDGGLCQEHAINRFVTRRKQPSL